MNTKHAMGKKTLDALATMDKPVADMFVSLLVEALVARDGNAERVMVEPVNRVTVVTEYPDISASGAPAPVFLERSK